MSEQAERTLVFIHMTGCEHCAEAKPHVKRFAEEFESEVAVKMLDLTTLDENIDVLGIELSETVRLLPPESVPAYVLVYASGEAPRTLASRGTLTYEELKAWCFAL